MLRACRRHFFFTTKSHCFRSFVLERIACSIVVYTLFYVLYLAPYRTSTYDFSRSKWKNVGPESQEATLPNLYLKKLPGIFDVVLSERAGSDTSDRLFVPSDGLRHPEVQFDLWTSELD